MPTPYSTPQKPYVLFLEMFNVFEGVHAINRANVPRANKGKTAILKDAVKTLSAFQKIYQPLFELNTRA
jgi:hypothetical protein